MLNFFVNFSFRMILLLPWNGIKNTTPCVQYFLSMQSLTEHFLGLALPVFKFLLSMAALREIVTQSPGNRLYRLTRYGEGKSMEGAIRVAIICSNRILRESLAYELSQQTGMTVIRSIAEACEILQEVAQLRPDVIITEFSSLGRDKLDDTRQLRTVYPEAKILIIGLNELEPELLECIEAGALGCLSLDASLEELHAHIRAVAAGGALCSPKVAKFLFNLITESAYKRERLQALNLTHLTRREREIVTLIEEGLSNKEIAAYLKIELQTVKNHVHNILEKLKVSNRREVAKYAREQGLLRSLDRVPVARVTKT